MSPRPLPSPEKALARVLKIAKFEGLSVLVISGLFALISALGQDWLGAVVGVVVAGAGAVEMHGAKLLKAGQSRGMDWLVRSQLLLLNTVLVYVAIKLLTITVASVNADVAAMTPEVRYGMDTIGINAVMIVKFDRLVYATVALATFLYQGGMARYYHRQRAIIQEALAAKDTGDIREG